MLTQSYVHICVCLHVYRRVQNACTYIDICSDQIQGKIPATRQVRDAGGKELGKIRKQRSTKLVRGARVKDSLVSYRRWQLAIIRLLRVFDRLLAPTLSS